MAEGSEQIDPTQHKQKSLAETKLSFPRCSLQRVLSAHIPVPQETGGEKRGCELFRS